MREEEERKGQEKGECEDSPRECEDFPFIGLSLSETLFG